MGRVAARWVVCPRVAHEDVPPEGGRVGSLYDGFHGAIILLDLPLVNAYCVDMDEAVSRYMAGLGKLRWQNMTDAQKAAHIRRMVAGQRKARLHRRAKKGAK